MQLTRPTRSLAHSSPARRRIESRSMAISASLSPKISARLARSALRVGFPPLRAPPISQAGSSRAGRFGATRDAVSVAVVARASSRLDALSGDARLDAPLPHGREELHSFFQQALALLARGHHLAHRLEDVARAK